jgi:hypothetical protein
MSEPISEAPAETTEERLRRLERMVATMHPGLAPDGYSPPLPPTGGPVIPLSLLVNAAVDPESARRRIIGELPILREIKLIVRMYLDPRYRLSRLAQLGVPTLIALAVFNYVCFAFLFPTIPFLSPIAERLILLLVGAAFAVVLSREALRYQAVLDYLARRQ